MTSKRTLNNSRDSIGRFARIYSDEAQRELAEWFGLDPRTAAFLVALYKHAGEGRGAVALSVELGCSISSVYLHIHRARAAMECEALDFGPQGYSLSEIGMAEVQAVLAEHVEALAA